MSFEVSNIKQDKSDRIPILDTKVSNNDFLLINLYNSNKKSEQLNTLSIILGGDLDKFLNLKYEARGRNPKTKNKSVAKFIYIKQSLGLFDIWRVRNPKKTACQKSDNSMSLVSIKESHIILWFQML